MAAIMKPLPDGKEYHFNVIYNHVSSGKSATPDQELSLQFVKFLAATMNKWDYTKYYYYDEHALLGSNVFNELFRVVKQSIYTIVIVSEEFSNNSWVEYCEQASFMRLILEKKSDALIPIILGKAILPEDLQTKVALNFSADPNTWSEEKLQRLKKVLDEGVPRQEHRDGIQRSEGDQVIDNPQPSMQGASDITQNRNERQMEALSSAVATSSEALQDLETSPSSRTDNKGYVMISYRRVEKEKAFWIKRVLEKNGYSVWIDDVNLGIRIYQGMADGVEGAHVVLLCMSEEYKESEFCRSDNLGTRVYQGMANGVEGAHVLLCMSEEYKESEFCRSEAEHARTIKKNILPVKVEDVALDGWLGIVTTGYLFVDLSGPHPSEEQMKLLLRKLAEYYGKEFQEYQIEPFVSNVESQSETGSTQDPGDNQSAGSE